MQGRVQDGVLNARLYVQCRAVHSTGGGGACGQCKAAWSIQGRMVGGPNDFCPAIFTTFGPSTFGPRRLRTNTASKGAGLGFGFRVWRLWV